MRNRWTGSQYSTYRGIFGVYLLTHFLALLPWGPELFSNRGVLPNAFLSPLAPLFPNILDVLDSPHFVDGLLLFAVLLSMLFAIGMWDRIAALLLWYVWACLLGRNPLISNPSLPFVGWLLLAHVFVPSNPRGSLGAWIRKDIRRDWEMPTRIYASAWIVMALAYSYSGYTKLVSQSWVDGSALSRILNNPLARTGALHEALLAMPPAILIAATWGSLLLELSFSPLALFRRARPWIWLAMVTLHLGLLATICFADLSAAMIILHLFTFDPGWVADSAPSSAAAYDAEAGSVS